MGLAPSGSRCEGAWSNARRRRLVTAQRRLASEDLSHCPTDGSNQLAKREQMTGIVGRALIRCGRKWSRTVWPTSQAVLGDGMGGWPKRSVHSRWSVWYPAVAVPAQRCLLPSRCRRKGGRCSDSEIDVSRPVSGGRGAVPVPSVRIRSDLAYGRTPTLLNGCAPDDGQWVQGVRENAVSGCIGAGNLIFMWMKNILAAAAQQKRADATRYVAARV